MHVAEDSVKVASHEERQHFGKTLFLMHIFKCSSFLIQCYANLGYIKSFLPLKVFVVFSVQTN